MTRFSDEGPRLRVKDRGSSGGGAVVKPGLFRSSSSFLASTMALVSDFSPLKTARPRPPPPPPPMGLGAKDDDGDGPAKIARFDYDARMLRAISELQGTGSSQEVALLPSFSSVSETETRTPRVSDSWNELDEQERLSEGSGDGARPRVGKG